MRRKPLLAQLRKLLLPGVELRRPLGDFLLLPAAVELPGLPVGFVPAFRFGEGGQFGFDLGPRLAILLGERRQIALPVFDRGTLVGQIGFASANFLGAGFEFESRLLEPFGGRGGCGRSDITALRRRAGGRSARFRS